MSHFEDEASWFFPDNPDGQDEEMIIDNNHDNHHRYVDDDSDGSSSPVLVETVMSVDGDNVSFGFGGSSSSEVESADPEAPAEVASYDTSSSSSSSASRANASYYYDYNESGVMGGVPTGPLLGADNSLEQQQQQQQQQDASSVAVFPDGYGDLGNSAAPSAFPDIQIPQQLGHHYPHDHHGYHGGYPGYPPPISSSRSVGVGVGIYDTDYPPPAAAGNSTRSGFVDTDSCLPSPSMSHRGFGGSGGFHTTEFYPPPLGLEDGNRTSLEVFEDEPGTPLSSLHHVTRSHSSHDPLCVGDDGGLERLPDDELEDTTQSSRTRSTTRRLGIGLMLCCLLLLVVALSVSSVWIKRSVQNESSTVPINPTLAPVLLLEPTRAPAQNPAAESPPATTEPDLDLGGFLGPRTVSVPVSNDGYLWLGGIILQEVEVQHSTTLLVQDSYHHTAAVSIVEFDTSGTLLAPAYIDAMVIQATITLYLANGIGGKDFVSLYARLYPNDQETTPDSDLNQYGFGSINFEEEEGWISFTVSLFQSDEVKLDVTDYFQDEYFPSQLNGTRDNVKILIAHDNADENIGSIVRFHSSESPRDDMHPKMVLRIDPPGFSRSPAPTVSPLPTASPSLSLAPTRTATNRPSSSLGPTMNPTVSPAPTIESYPICNICGAMVMANPQTTIGSGNGGDGGGGFGAALDIEKDEDSAVTCGELHQSGLKGEIRPKQCEQYQSRLGDTCCQERDNSGFICNLCGGPDNQTGEITNPDAVIWVPLQGETRTCEQFKAQAELGLIAKTMCETLQPLTAEACCEILL